LDYAKEAFIKLLHVYNNSFNMILLSFLIVIIVKGRILRGEDKDSYSDYKIILKNQIINMIVESIIVIFLFVFLAGVFQIKISEIFPIEHYIKLILGYWIICHVRQGWLKDKKYARDRHIEKIKDGECLRDAELLFDDWISHYQLKIDIQKERLAIWKSLAPMSFVVLLAGRFLDGADVNKYTVIFFAAIAAYFYKLWRSGKTLSFFMEQKYKYEKGLKEYLRAPIKKEIQKVDFRLPEPIREPELSTSVHNIEEPDGSSWRWADDYYEGEI